MTENLDTRTYADVAAEHAATPESFDLDAWLDDAQRPQRSVKVYGRADLIAQMDELERRIKVEEEAGERAVGDRTIPDLKDEWETLAAQFTASGLDVTVQGLNAADVKAVEDDVLELDGLPPKAKDKRRADPTPDEQARIGQALLAKAIVSPPMTVEQVATLTDRIGEAQVMRLVTAWRLAGAQEFKVKAPFSQGSSTPGAGDRD